MKSFPSTVNESQLMYGSTKSQTYKSTFDTERIKALNLNSSVPVLKTLLNTQSINTSNYQTYAELYPVRIQDMLGNSDTIKSASEPDNKVYYENPMQLPSELIALAKDYEWIYKYQAKSLVSTGDKSGNSIQTQIAHTSVVPSMFNPMYGVNAYGLIRNTPLLNDEYEITRDQLDVDDCSIRRLCTLSKHPNSPLGQERFKYADFMYCKDLGKVPNNHLITLRRFAHPVADHIGQGTNPKYLIDNDAYSWATEGDVGRLITWFDTDDNKLEDICKFNYYATWKKLDAQIQQEESKADSTNTGIIGMWENTFGASSSAYNSMVSSGVTGHNNMWGWLGSQLTPKVFQGIGSNNELLRNYDNNKVYTPPDTIQSTHIYEGKLEFSHEFTLNFSYQLRAYDNINPRSAFLDLIGNILEVTYKRGKFWGGDRKIIGPAQDRSSFDKTSAFIDNAFDKLGGMFSAFMNQGINFGQILGSIGSGFNNTVKQLKEGVASIFSGSGAEVARNLLGSVGNTLKNSGAIEGIKGYIKNALGRPQLYAWHSLLSGDDVGLWHVTIGNPLNPILSIGNLIMTNAQITQSGPLGIDDFPSELKVSVTLKHARPRDITEIGRMYTLGTSALYYHFGGHNIKDMFEPINTGTDQTIKNEDGTIKNETVSTPEQVMKEAKFFENDEFISLNDSHQYEPTFQNSSEMMIMRMNTHSNTMFNMMIQERA